MSVIWGCVDLSGKALPEGLCEAMEKPFHECKIDRFASTNGGNIVMGCGITYVHDESEREPLPIHDEELDIYFTADVHIYNRDDLIRSLCPDRDDITDGELFYLAYKIWGREFVKRIYGSYAYAAYHSRENELVVGADHMVSRVVYYNRCGGRLYFSTLVESIIHEGRKVRLNKTWCAYFLAMRTFAIMTNDTDTPYEDVYRMPMAHYYVFGRNGEHREKYWDPYAVEPLRLKSDDDYKARFRELFEKCSREALRVRGRVGIRLSSGFDSGAVAAFASRILEEQGKKLYSYTHVPLEREEGLPEYPSEREGVERLCEMHPNIEPVFMQTPDRNGVLTQKKIMEMGFFPVKSTTNIAWIDALTEQMAADGCKVSLTGQYGNATISRGKMETYLVTVLSQGRIFHFLKTLNDYGRVMGYSRKLILQHILNQFVPHFIRRRTAGDYLKGSIINREFAAEMGIGKRDRALDPEMGIYRKSTFKAENKLAYDGVPLAHVSDSDTKLMLRYGMQTLDITRDPRIVEFCLSLPMECFTRPGPETRRLCRAYLSDMYPPEILLETTPRGRQSADMKERLLLRWEEVRSELTRVCLSPRICEMADENRIRTALDDMSKGAESIDERDLKNLIYVYSLGVFLETHEREE